MYTKLFLAICFTCAAVVQDCFSSFTTITRREGAYVSIKCNDSFPQNVTVHWTRSGDDVFYRTGARVLIPHISRNDSGNYTCFWNGGPYHNATVDTVYIDVQYAVEVTRFSLEPFYPLEHHMLTINCWMDGNPKPSLVIEGNMTADKFRDIYETFTASVPSYLSGNSTIEVKNAPCGCSQVVTCRGYNTLNISGLIVNETAYRRKTVYTACPPSGAEDFIVTKLRGQGEGVEFDFGRWMHVGVYPIPTFTWSRDDGQPLREPTPERFNGTKIHIRNLVAADFGNYTMTASNPLGNYTAKFCLIFNGKDYTGSAPPTVTGFVTMVLALLFSTTVSRI